MNGSSIRGLLFYCQRAQTSERASETGADQAVFHTARARDATRSGSFNVIVYFTPQSDCQTNTLICTHPVHCEGVSRGTQGARTTSGEYVSSTPPPASLFSARVLYRSKGRVSPPLPSRSVSCLFDFIFFSSPFHRVEVGGWYQRYLHHENWIVLRDPLIMRIPRIAIIRHRFSCFLFPSVVERARKSCLQRSPGRMLANCGQIFLDTLRAFEKTLGSFPRHCEGPLIVRFLLVTPKTSFIFSTINNKCK